MIAEVIRNLLISSDLIRSQIGTYPALQAAGESGATALSERGATALPTTTGDSSAEQAAVFTFAPAPSDVEGKVITVIERGGRPWGCRAKRGTESEVEVEIWADKAGRSDAALRRLALDVYERLNRADLNQGAGLSGFEEWGCVARPPLSLRDEEGYPGYQIIVTVRLMEL